MGIRGYLTNVRRCYREESFTDATAWAVHELKNSIVYRTLGDNIGESVWDKDWDVLVVLDACRVDMMEEIADAYGFDVDTHLSRASESPDWIRREIERSEAGVGYVTANPFTHDERVGISEGDDVGYLDEVWKDKTETRNGVTTVFPDSVTDRALWAHNTIGSSLVAVKAELTSFNLLT